MKQNKDKKCVLFTISIIQIVLFLLIAFIGYITNNIATARHFLVGTTIVYSVVYCFLAILDWISNGSDNHYDYFN